MHSFPVCYTIKMLFLPVKGITFYIINTAIIWNFLPGDNLITSKTCLLSTMVKSLCGRWKEKESSPSQGAPNKQRKITSGTENYNTEGYRKVTMTMRTAKRKYFPWR